MTEKICPECNGEGVVDKDTEDERRCPTCDGSGAIPDDGQGSDKVWNTHSEPATRDPIRDALKLVIEPVAYALGLIPKRVESPRAGAKLGINQPLQSGLSLVQRSKARSLA